MIEPKKARSLHSYLGDRLPTDTLQEIMLLLWPFLDIGKATYPLAGQHDFDSKDIQSAIAVAVARDVRRIQFVVSKNLTALPPVVDLASVLRLTHGLEVYASISRDVFDSLFYNPMGSVVWSLRNTFPEEAHDENATTGKGVVATVYENILAPLALFLHFSIAGDHRAKSLEPLVQLLPRAIPIGESTDEPGVWLVVVSD